MPTKAIPEGYHTATPYLVVRNAAQAIEFYKKAFNAQEVMAAGLLVCGILFGRFLPQTGDSNTEMAQLRGQVENLHQMVALSMVT